MSASGIGSGTVKRKNKNAPGNRSDSGWEHGIEVDGNSKKMKCKYCKVARSRGIYKLKHHLASTSYNVEPCPNVLDEVRKKLGVILKNQSEESFKKRRRDC